MSPTAWKLAQAHEGFDASGRIVITEERTAICGDSYQSTTTNADPMSTTRLATAALFEGCTLYYACT